MRRIAPTGWFRRRTYEIVYAHPGDRPSEHEITTNPATGRLYDVLGVAETWSMIHAADEAWDGSTGEWTQFGVP